VIVITHKPHHALPVGDRLVRPRRGRMMGSYIRAETSLERLTTMTAGGEELPGATDPELAEVANEMAVEVQKTSG
jgi:ABC-type sugar transport system ATPase subunit